jgi:hypothetical protein
MYLENICSTTSNGKNIKMNKLIAQPLKWRILAAVIAVVLIALVIVHIYFASWLLGYVNNVLANINGYQGSVESIEIDLYRGAYRINKLVLNKKDGNIPTPFIAIDHADLSVQWGALFHGRIVSSATLIRPVINFAVNKSAKQVGTDVDWTKPIKDLMPIDTNYVNFEDGSVTYQDFSSTPPVNIFIHHMDGEVRNLRNVVHANEPFPSSVDVKGSSIGNGDLKIHGKMNILKEVPDMDLLLALENVNLPALNNYSEAYAAIDFKSGEFNLYSRMIVKDSRVEGYVKPVATHLSVDILKTANPVQIAWDATVAAVLKVFTNPSKDQFATQVNLEGNLGNVGTDTLSALGGILSNAFIKAMSKGFDQTGEGEIVKPAK